MSTETFRGWLDLLHCQLFDPWVMMDWFWFETITNRSVPWGWEGWKSTWINSWDAGAWVLPSTEDLSAILMWPWNPFPTLILPIMMELGQRMASCSHYITITLSTSTTSSEANSSGTYTKPKKWKINKRPIRPIDRNRKTSKIFTAAATFIRASTLPCL